MWADWVPGILMLVLFALEVPIAFAIAISALSFFLIDGGVPLNIFVQKMVSATDSYPLLAIPFFVLAGAIMNKAGITRRLLALASALVGHMHGRPRADVHRARHPARRPHRLVVGRRGDALEDARSGDGEGGYSPGLRRGHHLRAPAIITGADPARRSA
jgi:hypothetical protein